MLPATPLRALVSSEYSNKHHHHPVNYRCVRCMDATAAASANCDTIRHKQLTVVASWMLLLQPQQTVTLVITLSDTNSQQQWRRGCYCCSLNKSRRISKGGLFVFVCQPRGEMHCANVRAAAQACTSEVKDILVCFWLVFCSNQAAAAVAPSGLRIQGQTFTRRLKHVTESGSSNVHWAAHHRIISWPAVVNTHRSRTPFSRRAKHTPALTALNLSSMHAPPLSKTQIVLRERAADGVYAMRLPCPPLCNITWRPVD